MELAWQRLDGKSGHEVGRQLIRDLCGGTLPEIQHTEQGKPYFLNSDLHFSISHTKNHAFCCISTRNIGMDAEECDREIDLRLAEKFLSSTEKQHFDFSTDKRECLLRLWVLKEAYGKLLGKGIGNYLSATDFSPDDPRIQIIDGCFVAVMEEPSPGGRWPSTSEVG